MPAASILSSITDALTSLIGDHGLYAIFILMLVDAVLPAASELVMVYGGALAAGAFAGQDVVLFGETIEPGFWAYFAVAMSGTLGYTVGSVIGWAIGLYAGRPTWRSMAVVAPRPRQARAGRPLVRALRRPDRLHRTRHSGGRSFIAIPAGIARVKFVRYTVLTFLGTVPWCFGLAGIGYGFGRSYERFRRPGTTSTMRSLP